MRAYIPETNFVRTLFTRRTAAAAATAALAACSDSAEIVRPTPPAIAEILARYVALGNSITAGYQSGGITDSTQQQSFAALIADAAGVDYRYVGIPKRCAPPIANFQTQERIAVAPTDPPCVVQAPPAFINNVAVPGATIADATTSYTGSYSPLTSFILGGKSQVQRALDANPTFVSMWLGNNDVLAAGVTGLLAPVAGVSPGVTAPATFRASYGAAVDSLVAGGVGRGVLIGVVNVANAPILFPAAALFNPAFRAGFEQFTGGPLLIDASCGTASAPAPSLISFAIVPQIRAYRLNPATAGAHPPIIACAAGAVPAAPLVGNIFVLDAAEQTSITNTVTDEYNAYIQAKADSVGYAYYDPNAALQQLRAEGCVSTVPNLASATQPYGACISLDGVHPSLRAHQVVASGVIGAINTEYDTALPTVTVTP